MDYMKISGTDIDVSRISLGTWAIGGWMWGGTDERRSIKTIHAALEKGINLVDTAPVYGFGKSEEIVGKAIDEYVGERESFVISTKAGIEWKDDGIFRNASRERIFKEVKDSLERLGTDYIDIYHIHWPDPETPIGETAKAMKDLYNEGKIRAIGVSNFSTEQMREFNKYAPLHVSQPPYNLFERKTEEDILPYCLEKDIHMMTYGSLCRGLLSGKMDTDTTFDGDDMRKADDPKFSAPHYSQYLEAVEKLDEYANERYGRDVLHLAVRWILDRGVHTALWGARKPEQLEPVDDVMDWNIPNGERKKIVNIIQDTIEDPVGPEFMAPPTRSEF
ncbi:MAG: aldo/keto reductase [Thermoplasmatota archaeon]